MNFQWGHSPIEATDLDWVGEVGESVIYLLAVSCTVDAFEL